MINPDTRYSKTFNINTADVDAKRQASLQSICRYLQEMAALHANEMKLGFHDMMKEKRAWVMAMMAIRIERYPKFQDAIEVTTWSNGPDGRYAMRDFLITDEDGNELARASSTWFVIDIEALKICRLDGYFDDYEYSNIDYSLGRKPERIKPLQEPDLEEEIKAKYSDLDINGHVNNVKYVDMVLDMFHTDFRLSHDIHEIEMNFLKETKEGDTLGNMLKIVEADREYLHCLFNKDIGKASFTARTLWH